MQPVKITDPAWYTTFPHLVAPGENEWIAGLLLRCDEVNHWGSGGTLTYLLDPTQKRYLKGGVGLLREDHLEKLADALAVPVSVILATTYQAELARLYGWLSQNPPGLSTSPVPFHICPMCLGEARMLRRHLVLPGITHCPLHGLSLVERCQCGKPLLPFHQYASPFTCYSCAMDWASLPGSPADPERISKEHSLLSYYEFFLTQASPDLLANTLRLISETQTAAEKSRPSHFEPDTLPLENVVRRLVELDITPHAILLYAGQISDQGSDG